MMRRAFAACAALLALAGPAAAQYPGGYSFGILTNNVGVGSHTLYAADPAYGVVCDGSTNNDAALAAISTAVQAGGFDIVLPTTGQSCKYTTWNLSGLTNIRVRGGAGYTNNSGSIGTALECTRTDASICLNAKDTRGFILSNLAMIKADAHTGIVLDMSSTASTWNKNKIENVEFKRASGTGTNGTALYVRNTVDLTIIVTRFSHVNNGIVGGFNAETTTGTASIVCISCDFTVLNTAVLNPGPFWSFFAGNWEVTLSGVPVALVSQSTDTVKALGFYGVTFADATAAGTWITFNGGIWGFTMSGGSMSGNQASTNGIAFNGGAAGTQAVSISGVNFATLNTAISFSNVCGGTSISGNVFTSVTNRIVNGSGSCYTSNWWQANAPTSFNNAIAGTILNGQAATDPIWTATPALGSAGGTTGALDFKGVTSGTARITAQAVAGAPTITIPNASGTIAVSATSPLVLNATTGALTCPTCSSISGAALTKTDDTNITVTLGGSPTTALVNAASLTLGWTGTLAASRGGFGADVSAQSGVPLFAVGVPTFTGTSGSGNFARVTSPTFVTPTLGAATATSINKVALTTPAIGSTLTIADGKTATFNASTTFGGTDGKTLSVNNSGTLGGGDGWTLSIGASKSLSALVNFTLTGGDGASLSVAASKTLTANNSLTLAGTDGTTMTFPSVSASIPGLAVANTFTASQAVTLSQAAQTSISVNNTNVSTSASAAIVASSNSGTFTASANNNPNTTGQAGFTWTGASGMLFAATHASGPLIFDTGGFNERMRISAAGAMSVGTTTDPGAPGIILLTSYLQTGAVAVASLPACGAGTKGARHFVTDANATTFNTTAAGGGANNMPVTCNGTNWVLGAAANDNMNNRMAA